MTQPSGTDASQRHAAMTGVAPAGRSVGRVALVTGAATGIGAATARRLAADGARVVLVGRDGAALEEVRRALEAAGGLADVAVVDVRDGTALEDVVGRTIAAHGRIDSIVSNAGIGRHGRVDEQPADELQELLDTHVAALWHLARAAVPAMRRQGSGAIVAVTSVHAYATLPLVSAYAASKTAILGLVRGLALDHAAEGIRVNAVAPGSVDTPMLRASARRRSPDDPDAMLRAWGERHPIGRVIEADEVASAIAFLCSDDASAITGTCLPVDGGLLARLAL